MATANTFSVDDNGNAIIFNTFKDDTKPIRGIVKKNGTEEDLSGYSSPNFSMWKSSDGSLIVDAQAAATGAETGEIYYNFAAGDVDEAGVFGGKFQITDSNSKTVSIPEDGLIKININEPTQT